MITVISQIVSNSLYTPSQAGVSVRTIQAYPSRKISEISYVGMPWMRDCLAFFIVSQEIKFGRRIHTRVILGQVDTHEKG